MTFIEKLTGRLALRTPTGVVIEAGGVGYGVEMPLSDLCHIPAVGEEVALWIHTLVREDALRLFGFLAYGDKTTFGILLALNGVGPRVALAMLSTLNTRQICAAVNRGEAALFEKVPGIGARKAEKLLVELKPKTARLLAASGDGPRAELARELEGARAAPRAYEEGAPAENILDDLRSALDNLGFKEKAVRPALDRIRQTAGAGQGFQELLRLALAELTGGSQARSGSPDEADTDPF